jgi:putative glycosyltransferase (TIGR04372 family)
LNLKSAVQRLGLAPFARLVMLQVLIIQRMLVRLGLLKYDFFSDASLKQMGNLALARGKHKLAIEAYTVALGRQPEDILLRLQIGVTAFLAGNYPECEKWFASLEHSKQFDQWRWELADSQYRILDRTWLLAIGHVAFLDTYIKATRLGWLPEKTALLAYDPVKPPAGWPLFRYFGQYVKLLPSSQPDDALDRLVHGRNYNQISPLNRDWTRAALSQPFWFGPDASGRTRWFAPYGAAVEAAWKAREDGPIVAPSAEERARFRHTMQEVYGLPTDAWFVLLHVREPGYHAAWHRHHPGTRNAEIRTYDKVIDFVLAQGGWVVRGGDPTMKKIPRRERVIDYATSQQRSAEIDILLCAECAYFVGTNSGFSVVPPVFGKRCALTNWSPIGIPNWYLDDIYIPKLVRRGKNGKYLSFTELFSSVAGWSQFMRDFKNGLVIEDNHPDDLLAVVEELHAEVFGSSREISQKDAERLQRFNDIAIAHGGYVGSRMSYGFLKKYESLLE